MLDQDKRKILEQDKIINLINPIFQEYNKTLTNHEVKTLNAFKIEIKNILLKQEKITTNIEKFTDVLKQQISTEQKILTTTKQQFDNLGKLFVENNDKIIKNLRKFFNEYQKQGDSKSKAFFKSIIATYKEKKLGISHLYKIQKGDIAKLIGLKITSGLLHSAGILGIGTPLLNIAANKINDFSNKIIQEKYQKTKEEFEKLINENKQRYEELASSLIKKYEEIKSEKKDEYKEKEKKGEIKLKNIALEKAKKEAQNREFKNQKEYNAFIKKRSEELFEELRKKLENAFEKKLDKELDEIEKEKIEKLKQLSQLMREETIKQMHQINNLLKQSKKGEIDIEKGAKQITDITENILRTHLEEKKKELESEKLIHIVELESGNLSKEELLEKEKEILKINSEIEEINKHLLAIRESERKGTTVEQELTKIENPKNMKIEIKQPELKEKIKNLSKKDFQEIITKPLKKQEKILSTVEKAIKTLKDIDKQTLKKQTELLKTEEQNLKLKKKEFEWKKAIEENKELSINPEISRIKSPKLELQNFKLSKSGLLSKLKNIGKEGLVDNILDFVMNNAISLMLFGKAKSIFKILGKGKGLIGSALSFGKNILSKGGKILSPALKLGGGVLEKIGAKSLLGWGLKGVVGAFDLSNPIGWAITGVTLLLDEHVRSFLEKIGKGIWNGVKSIFSLKHLKSIGKVLFKYSPFGLVYTGITKFLHSKLLEDAKNEIGKIKDKAIEVKNKSIEFVKNKITDVKSTFKDFGKDIFHFFFKPSSTEKVKPVIKHEKEIKTHTKEKHQIEKVKEQIHHHYNNSQVIQTIHQITKGEEVKEVPTETKTIPIPTGVNQPSSTEMPLMKITTGDENSIPSILFKHFYFIGG